MNKKLTFTHLLADFIYFESLIILAITNYFSCYYLVFNKMLSNIVLMFYFTTYKLVITSDNYQLKV
jgi:hypothetical protein